MTTEPGRGLLGRVTEREALERLLADVRGGKSGALVIRGEAGIGKTALLRHARDVASGFRIARIRGVEAELELPFAGLHQLCAPMLDRLDALPEPQQNALSVALGLSRGDPPARFLVALAVLSLLSAVAEKQPLACLVDDAQWLDDASDQVLAFVARRLLAESVAIVFAVRDPSTRGEFEGLRELRLAGLDEDDARALLERAIPGRLDPRVRDRIVAETGGNPLALLELPHTMSAAELAGGFEVPAAGDLPGQIEQQYMRRVGELPAPTRGLMLLAAADPVGDASLLWRAADQLGIGPSDLAPAETVDLIDVGARVRFRHPLVRSAVYRAAPLAERQRVHEALAEATDPQQDADRRAWHRALATAGPDEEVAADLERSAGRAAARGGFAAAAALRHRAVALTQEPGLRAERALAAADASLQAGALDAVLGLVATAEAGPLDDFQRARVGVLRAHVAFASGLGSDAPPLLVEAARRLEPFDVELARETYLIALAAVGMAGSLAERDHLLEICRAVQALPRPAGAPAPLDWLLDGLTLLIADGHAAAASSMQSTAEVLAEIPIDDVLRWGFMAPTAALALWDFEGFQAIAERHVQVARDAGALTYLPQFLSQVGMACAWTGDFATAEMLIAEIDSVAAAIASPIGPYMLLRLRSLQGNEAQVSAAIETAIERAEIDGQGHAAQWAHWARAVLYNGLARYGEAASAAREAALDSVYPWPATWALAELVEAASRAGDADLASEALERLAAATQPFTSDAARGLEARSRALLANGVAADELYREAIACLRAAELGPDAARAHLLYGEWLRREGRRVDARDHLRTAHEMFTTIGMEAFAERSRRELAATGERVRNRKAESRDELTPQELQIARLAREGLSNPEIGARLFLSPRTVEWHLRKVFSKLGIHSRLELADALPKSESGMVPA